MSKFVLLVQIFADASKLICVHMCVTFVNFSSVGVKVCVSHLVFVVWILAIAHEFIFLIGVYTFCVSDFMIFYNARCPFYA